MTETRLKVRYGILVIVQRPWNRRVAELGLLSVILSAGCEKSRFSEPFFVATRPASAVIERPGNIVLEARCLSGEQLIGGGYMLPGGDAIAQLGVLTSYPSALDTWTVTVDNPDFAPA